MEPVNGATTQEEALAIYKASSGLPINHVYQKPESMCCPTAVIMDVPWEEPFTVSELLGISTVTLPLQQWGTGSSGQK